MTLTAAVTGRVRGSFLLWARRYKRHNLKELHRLLHRCNEGLKKFSHVNKKALDQYASFTEQRQEMQKRQDELNKSDEVWGTPRPRPTVSTSHI